MKNILIALISLFVFIGCKDDNRPDPPVLPKVQEMIISSVRRPNLTWVVLTIKYNYDNLSRVTSMSVVCTDTGGSGGSLSIGDTLTIFKFSYNGDAMLPYSLIRKENFQGNHEQIHHFTYDNQNRLKTDSTTILGTHFNTYLFNYIDNKTLITHRGPFIPILPPDTLTLAGNNIAEFTMNAGSQIQYHRIQYGNRINPLSQINIAPLFQSISSERNPIRPYWSIWTGMTKNNIIKQDMYYAGGIWSGYSYSVRYQDDQQGRIAYSILRSDFHMMDEDTVFYKY